MFKILGYYKILIMCFILYMLMVLPVFANSVYKLPSTNRHVNEQVYVKSHYPSQPPVISAPAPSQAMPYGGQQQYNYPTQQRPYPSQVKAMPYGANPRQAQPYYQQQPTYQQQPNYQQQYKSQQVAPMRTINPNAKPYEPGQFQPRTTFNPHTDIGQRSYGQDGSIWMIEGGARWQYDALPGPTQMYTNNRPVKDPALVYAPPLYPQHQRPKVVKSYRHKQVKNPKEHNKNKNVKDQAKNPQTKVNAPLVDKKESTNPGVKEGPGLTMQHLTQSQGHTVTSDNNKKPEDNLEPKKTEEVTTPQSADQKPVSEKPVITETTKTMPTQTPPYEGPANPVGENLPNTVKKL